MNQSRPRLRRALAVPGAAAALIVMGSIIAPVPGGAGGAAGDDPRGSARVGAAGFATIERVEPARFHHVHLNVRDVEASIAYYERFFGASAIRYRGGLPALFTERSFLLLHEVAEEPRDNFGTSWWHIGWAGVDGHAEFDWRLREGIDVQTPITPLGQNFYMYFWGPDRELVEVYTGSRNHRFEHVHLLASDIDETLSWFQRHLGLEPVRRTGNYRDTRMRTNTIRVDNVNMIVFEVPDPVDDRVDLLPAGATRAFAVTDGRAMDHVAFSYREILPVYERLSADGVDIVRGIVRDTIYGHLSFFVRGPDGLLVEIVEDRPLPEGIWDLR
jgi:catechol 2,3-dioxygenase-like lactoylglutathione lyase family enzyme